MTAAVSPLPLLLPLAAEESFRLLVESVQDYAIFMLDPAGRVMSWNAGARRIKGYEAAEIIGRSFEAFYAAEAVERGWPREVLRRAAAAGRFEDEGWRYRKDGSSFWASVVLTALHAPDGTLVGFAKVTRDLSERRAHEEALRRSEEQLRLMFESVRDYAIFMLDPQGRVLSWNAGAQAILGYAANEAVGRSYEIFHPATDVAEGRPQSALQAARTNGREEIQGWRLRKGGDAFWASMIITPVLDPKGELRGYAAVTRDLSAQRRLLELEQATRRTHEFLAVLAHELRNPLAPIRNAVSIMQLHPQMPPAIAGARDVIDRQLSQLTRLVDDLLDVARISTGKFQLQTAAIDFRDVVAAGLEAVRSLAAARLQRLECRLPDVALPMHADAPRLIQALQNVLHNAVKYTPEGGHIGIDVRVDGRACITTVTDTGRGIAPQALERIFQMFVQEEEGVRSAAEPGLGIGLNLARSLVERHGGRLTAHSAGRGTGASFTMVLPLNDVSPSPGLGDAGPERDTAVRMRALVVDDNRDSADTMCRLLDLLGHQATAAYDAAEGMMACGRFDPDVVFLDLNLPDADGFALLESMRRVLPGGTLYAAMTGYGQDRDRASTARAGFVAHLVKPVGFADLRDVLLLVAKRRTVAAATAPGAAE